VNDKDTLVADEPVIVYSVKDVLLRIEQKLDTAMGALGLRMDKVEADVTALKTESATRTARRDDRRWIVTAAASAIVAMAAILALVIR
jgi:hypothetical protein